jgi:hypothetical protein
MLADILTKEVPKAKHIWCVYNFGLKLKVSDLHYWEEGSKHPYQNISSGETSSPQTIKMKSHSSEE